MKPVTGPFSPSFSTLKLARASSPVELLAFVSKNTTVGNQELTKHGARVQVRAQELAIPAQTGLGSEALHIRHLHEASEEVSETLAGLELGVDVDLVLPLELGLHGPELCLCAVCGLDVIHNVDVDVIEDDNLGISAVSAIVDDVTKDHAGVG